MASVAQLIRSYARRYGVDPRAALAVARTEGGLRFGAVGDQGTSYGPFQLHVGGALPRGKDAAWANSPEGIAYALQRMAASGARGKTGRAAIEAIVRNFERPADPGSEVTRALSYYGGGSATSEPSQGASVANIGDIRDSGGDSKRAVLSALISASQERNPDYEGVITALGQLGATRRAATPPSTLSSSTPAGGGATSGDLLAQLRKLGLADAITSGERSVAANRATGGSPTSYHLPGGPDAYDLNPSDSNIPALLSAARRNPGQFKELFGPMDWYIKNGRIRRGRFPGHDDHYHVAR